MVTVMDSGTMTPVSRVKPGAARPPCRSLSGSDMADRAIAHTRNAIRADATYAPAYWELGLAHYCKGDRPQAIAALERYLALEPRAKDAHRINTAIQDLKRS